MLNYNQHYFLSYHNAPLQLIYCQQHYWS